MPAATHNSLAVALPAEPRARGLGRVQKAVESERPMSLEARPAPSDSVVAARSALPFEEPLSSQTALTPRPTKPTPRLTNPAVRALRADEVSPRCVSMSAGGHRVSRLT